jgi:hypothetical protein
LQLDAGGPWVDVRAVTQVDEYQSPDGGRRVALGGRGIALTCEGPVLAVVDAIAECLYAHERERAYEAELGRILALDAGQLPAGEDPLKWGPGAPDDQPYG